jgi:hypothetical protein
MNEIGLGKESEVSSLLGTPGLSLLDTVGNGPIRNVFMLPNIDNYYYVVSGNKFYSYLTTTGTKTEIGTLSTSDATPIGWAFNGTNVLIVQGNDTAYIYTPGASGSGTTWISHPDSGVSFPDATKVVYQDGYFIVNNSGTGNFYASNLNSTTFDWLSFAQAEGSPDNIVSLISDHRDLWVFGAETTEVYYNSGNADFPFERINGAFIEHGCIAANSVAKMNNEVYWLGRDTNGQGVVYRARGHQPERISTHAVEAALKNFGFLNNCTAYTYQEEGHNFYVLNNSSFYTNVKTTWVFDASTNMWHERTYTNANSEQERHRVSSIVYDTVNARFVAGDHESGNLYIMGLSIYSDNGDEIHRIRRTPHVSSGLNRVFYNYFQVDMEAGVGLDGLSTTQGANPQAMLRWSDDGGYSWSNEHWRDIGKIGERNKRIIWRRLGSARDRVFELKITDPVKVAIIGAQIELVQGVS